MLLALVKERITHGKTVQLVPARGLSDVDVEVCSWVEGGGWRVMVGWTAVEADALIVTVGFERGQKVTRVLVVLKENQML
mgnify:CR=1 FL=1